MKFNTLNILTTDFISVQPNIHFDSTGVIDIDNVQIHGGLMQLDGHDGVKIAKYSLNCSVPDNSSYGYEDGVYINSKGDINMLNGKMSGLNIKVVGRSISFSDSVIIATRIAGSNNVALQASEYLKADNI